MGDAPRHLDASRKPWSRQREESAQAFQAFTVYAELGPDRSNVKVAERLGKSQTLMNRWSSWWWWVARATAYDSDLAIRAQKAAGDAVASMRERHVQSALMLQQTALAALRQLSESDLAKLKPADIVRMFATGAEIERLSRGEPTEIVEGRDDGSDARREVLDHLKRIRERLVAEPSTNGHGAAVPVTGP